MPFGAGVWERTAPMVIGDRPAAIALVRRDVPVPAVDLHELAARHGFRLVFTVVTDAGPRVTALAPARHIGEWEARAVVVPGFEHTEAVRHLVAGIAALITPMCLYPRGHRWAGAGHRWDRPVDG